MTATSNRVRAGLLSAVLAASLLLAGGPYAETAHACSCAGSGSAEEAFRIADAVFAGEAAEVGKFSMGQAGLAPVTFDVKGTWKGVEGDSVVVHGQGPGASCGLDFERGETYLVFAGKAGEGLPLQTGLCDATRQASVETARNMFGPPTGVLPETGGVPPEGAERGVVPTLAAATVLLASLVAGVILAPRLARGPGR